MQYGLKLLGFGFLLAAGFAVSACGGEDDGGEPGSDGGTTSSGGSGSTAGSAGSGTGGSANGGTGAGSAGGSNGGSGSGGSSANGGASGSAGTGAGGNGTSGGTGGVGGTGGAGGSGGGEACVPASSDGIAFSGSCTDADHCSDQYDTSFGVEVLEQVCTGQSGTWSTAHCNAADWDKKCTQEVLGGVYVQYLPSDGICVLGCEEAL